MAVAVEEKLVEALSAPAWFALEIEAAAPATAHPLLEIAARFAGLEGYVLEIDPGAATDSVWDDALDVRVASL